MRKPRDFDAEPQALTDKAKQLKDRKLRHLESSSLRPVPTRSIPRCWRARCSPSSKRPTPRGRRAGANAARPSFSEGHAGLRTALLATAQSLRRTIAARHRHDAVRARTETRAWAVTRRERTRHLIELGGLVAKAGLIELATDDRAVLLGAFLAVADRLAGDDRERAMELCGRRGQRAFEAEGDAYEAR